MCMVWLFSVVGVPISCLISRSEGEEPRLLAFVADSVPTAHSLLTKQNIALLLYTAVAYWLIASMA